MKKITPLKAIISVVVIALVFSLSIYFSNPLVRRGKLNISGFLFFLLSQITNKSDNIGMMAYYAYSYSENDQDLENYSIDLYNKSARGGSYESKNFLGAYYLFKKNDTAKGLKILEELNTIGYPPSKYVLGIYYILKEGKNKEGLALVKEAEKGKYKPAYLLSEILDKGMNIEEVEKSLDKWVLGKSDSAIEFGL